MSVDPVPKWKMHSTSFDTDYTSTDKESGHLLATSPRPRSHIDEHYPKHIQICTDGSILTNDQSGAACVVPALKVDSRYHVEKD